jgi:serine/threonine-protein phosphatase 2B catalytic subunit
MCLLIEAELLRNKVKAMSRMMKMFKTLREENESVVQLKGICTDGKVPKGLLLEGKKAIENELVDRSKVFTNAKKLDAMNEAMPHSPGNLSTHSNSPYLESRE